LNDLILKLKEIKCDRIILVTPSCYDQYVTGDNNWIGVNDALVRFGGVVKRLSQKHNTKIVDMNDGMTSISRRIQRQDPSFSFNRVDRIHPTDLGHQLMAYLFLTGFKTPSIVSSIEIDARSRKFNHVQNAEVGDLSVGKSVLEFIAKEKALPYAVDDELKSIFDLVPFNKDLNRQFLRFRNIRKGNWKLAIDDQLIGQYSEKQLNAGINIGAIQTTPQYKQSEEVLQALMLYHWLGVQHRHFRLVNGLLEKNEIDLSNDIAIKKFFEVFPYEGGSHATGYFIGIFSSYFEFRDNLDSFDVRLEETYSLIYDCNKPISHRYKLVQT